MGFTPTFTLVELILNFSLASLKVAALVLSKKQPVPLIFTDTVKDRGASFQPLYEFSSDIDNLKIAKKIRKQGQSKGREEAGTSS